VRITPKAKETAAVCEVFRANAFERRAELGYLLTRTAVRWRFGGFLRA
jgi:hypothetical protein